MAKRKNTVKNKAGGFIGLFRSLLNWEYAEDDAVFSCFVKLLLAVNYKDNKWCGEVIKRGSIIGSMDTLCTTLHMKKDKLKRCLNALSECGTITVMVKPNKYHLIIVNNYNMYQNVVVGISDNLTANSSANNPADKTADRTTDNTTDSTANNPATTKKYIYKKDKKVSVAPTGRTDTVKKETPPTAASPEGEPPAAFDYEKINWKVVQVFEGDEGKGLVFGNNMPYRSVCRFARANGIDDYTAGDFHTVFERSGIPFPRNWEDLLLRYSRADSKQRDEFKEQMLNGGYSKLWEMI